MKVPDTVIKIKDLELVEFMDYTQTILNHGLYQFKVLDTVPNWDANEGESAILSDGTHLSFYVYVGGVWAAMSFNSIGTLILFDQDGDTGITPEYTADEDIIRFFTAGFNNFAMGTVGFAMAPNKPIIFDGLDGDSKWVYDSADRYLKGYTDGVLRQEM